MAKLKIIKKALLTSLLTAGLSVSGFSIVNSLVSHNSSNVSQDTLQANSSNLQATSSATKVLGNYDSDTSGNFNIDFPKQYYSFDTSGTSYALITKQNDSGNFDQVTRYWISGGYAGNGTWTITKSEFEAGIGSSGGSSGGSLNLESVLYVDGGISGKQLLYILVKNSTNSYLFSADWQDGQNLTLEQTFSNKIYNTMYVQSSLNQTIVLFDNKAIKSGTAVSLDFAVHKESDKTSPPEITGTINLNDNILASYFSANDSKLVDSFDDGNYFYFVYQLSSFTNESNGVQTDVNNYATVFRVAKNDLYVNNKTININTSNIASLSLTKDETKNFSNNKLVSVKAVKKNNSNFALFLSQGNDSSSASSTAIVATFSESSLSTPSTFTLNSYDLPTTKRISQIRPYYNNGLITGFLSLDSEGKKIIMLNASTLQPSTSVYYSGTDIYNIVTNSHYSTWFFQNKSGTISELSGNTLIFADLNTSNGTQLNEFAASVTVKNESEISPSVLYKKVGDSSSNVDNDFKNYLNKETSYLDFLTITNSDVRFGNPNITGKVTNIAQDGNSGNYWVTIDFEQQLRKRAVAGQVENNGSKVVIATAYLKFINANVSVSANTKNNVPASITSKKASDISDDDIKNYLVNMKNVGSYTILKSANDSQGILNVQIIATNVWVNNILVGSQVYNLTFGTANDPFFQVDLLGGLDGSVTGVTSIYLDLNSSLKNQLYIKYGTLLPSQITANQVLNDFVILGNAFTDRLLLSQGIVNPPMVSNVSLVPVDADGTIFVTVTIPKIGSSQNVVYSFQTGAVFAKDVTSNQNVYLAFKTNDEVLNYSPPVVSGVSNPYSSYSPSSLASLINTTDVTQQISNLKVFVNASNFVYNMLNETDTSGAKLLTVSAVSDDVNGYLTITFNFLNPLPGSTSNQLSQMFTGFATKGNVSGTVSTFSWGNVSDSAFAGKNATEVTVDDLTKANLFVYGGSAASLSKTISLTPLNNSGALVVTITFNNWIQNGANDKLVTIPQKTFTTVVKNGLIQTNTSVNMIVWKSYDQLLQSYKSLSASSAVTTINNLSTDLAKLQALANISTDLEKSLTTSTNALELVLESNDSLGQITATARVNLSGSIQIFTTTISGFSLIDPSYSVYLVNTDSTTINSLKNKLPSEITDQEIGRLITISTNNLSSVVTKNFNDIDGTLTVSVSIVDNSGNVVASTSRMYSGFATNVPKYKGTDWLIVALSVVIPAVLLTIPILVVVLYYNRRDEIRFSKKLDKRLSEMTGQKKNKDVKHIKDLLNL
ncbi:MAG: hypothetical protein K2I67_02335 [Malacoplasma sp.]|nr:hypothetical protein [Malacoplasma sp.]